ncbi:vWA domain-containing protein [Blastococcus saxobsidens]|uniref:Mg-chelatase subunit ChlD (Modular protein) n=1 Tax=Blastococcus saxobsidens (strain DD2) TaxID=1146883 RepID=H6RTA8_BLASD|nr:vWA domain-containing protein [Blastococcus saxobsidens]CCG05608.1 Mg-chelatase subunit ChlD (modular protein) [Blastococcus saxobsidens DD2]
MVSDPAAVEQLLRSQVAHRASRDQLSRSNPDFDAISPQAGQLDAAAVAELAARDPDAAARVLAAAARAFDPALRSAARALAARLPVGRPRSGTADRPGTSRLVTRREPTGSDVDLDASLAARGAEPHWRAEHLHTRGWRSTGRAVVLLVDASGSVAGDQLATAILTASALAQAMRPGDELGVVAFWSSAVVLRPLSAAPRVDLVVDRLSDLRGGGTTDLELALRTAAVQLARSRAADRQVLLLSDGLPTESPDPVDAARALARVPARLQVMALSAEEEASASCAALAAAGGGGVALLDRPSRAPAAVRELLG